VTPAGAFLEFDGVSKSFPGVRALDAVSFGVAAGSAHALVGENGAGKSTLLKILSGVYRPDAGTVRIDGRAREFRSAADAFAAGVAVIYQELQLVPEMTVAENLFLGHLPSRAGVVDGRALREAAARQLEVMGERIDPRARVGRLPIAQRQMVEIAKALTRGAKVIAFDEPTSSLSDREVRRLFAIIGELKRKGCAVLYVSHRMAEIFEVCDAVTVLRDGRHVETFGSMRDVTHDVLVNRMVGRDIRDIYGYSPRPRGAPALEIDRLAGPGLAAPATLSVARGEIVGLFGLVGAGRTELLRLVYGAARPRAGTVKVMGAPARIRRPADAIRLGMMLCPEDRKNEGIIAVRSVLENVNISARRTHARLGFVIDEAWERRNASAQVERLSIRTPSLAQLAMNLSGGNQQKVVLARWLSETVRVLLLDEPTRGIDVGARSEIYATIYELARSGIGILMASSDLPEVLGVSDRVVVMRSGQIVADLARGRTTDADVLRLALPAEDRAAVT